MNRNFNEICNDAGQERLGLFHEVWSCEDAGSNSVVTCYMLVKRSIFALVQDNIRLEQEIDS